MITHGLKKKPANIPNQAPTNKKKSKSKSKQKSKQKSKKFSAKDFLQALIDLQNTNCSTNKKIRNTTRDISSALTIATPNLQKTISASKIRSKSSFSQYRKKLGGAGKQPLTINLCAIITQQDNVQYTQKTARSSYKQQQNQQNIDNDKNKLQQKARKLNINTCVIKIQRAWRNYQTYKMVHNIYLKQKRNRQLKNIKIQQKSTPNQVHIKVRKPDFQKTLRIKKQHAIKKQQRKQEQFWQTKKIINQRYKQQSPINQYKPTTGNRSPIQQFKSQSHQSVNSNAQEQLVLNRMKQRQAIMLKQVIQLIQKQSKVQTKQQLINKLIQKCQDNKRILQNDIKQKQPQEQQQQFLSSQQKQQNQQQPFRQLKQSRSQQLKQNQQIQTSKQLSKSYSHSHSYQKIIQIKDQTTYNYKQQQKSFKSESESRTSSQNSLDLDYDDIHDQVQQLKIFQHRLQIIKDQKYRKLEHIDDNLLESKISNTQAIQRKQAIYNNYQRQKKKIDKNKKQYLFSLSKLKKIALKCQKSALKQSLSSSKIRKSFSAGNTVLKQVLQDIKIIQIQKGQQQIQFFTHIWNRNPNSINQPSQNKPLTTTPILQLPSPNKPTQSQQQLLDQKNNTEILKQYSQQIQQLIQKQLIEQFVNSVFLDDKLFQYFKPYVEQIYQFRKVPDTQIMQFLNILKPYLPQNQIMLQRVNQQINPTSIQILRIIRDIDYQIDQYQLIVPQPTFKKYRASIQKLYQQKQITDNKILTQTQITIKTKNKQITQKVLKLQQQKIHKIKKYRNFQRDLRIMYMKSVFNCINQFLIQTKSNNAFMNARSSIGPGQLSLAIKQYNQPYNMCNYNQLLNQVQHRIQNVINTKCSIPSFKNYHDIEQFQKQVMKQIKIDSNQNQFKWVNYMDQVLEIWQDLCVYVVDFVIGEAVSDISIVFL